MGNLNEHVHRHVPRCLSTTAATPVPCADADSVVTAFSLAQKSTAADEAEVLGYPLSDYNPACVGKPDFISPLTLRWPDGGEDHVFDSAQHGYHGQMGASANYRGKGRSQVFKCGDCGKTRFRVSVQFDYWGGCEDLLEDEPDISIEDYFNNILFVGKCTACGTVNEILNMDI